MTKQITALIEQAEKDLRASRSRGPAEPAFHGMVVSALAHATTGLLILADAMLTKPQIPGLPAGYQVETDQSPADDRKWAYTFTRPDGSRLPSPRHQWDYPETALLAGIRAAQQDFAGPDEPGGSCPGSEDLTRREES